ASQLSPTAPATASANSPLSRRRPQSATAGWIQYDSNRPESGAMSTSTNPCPTSTMAVWSGSGTLDSDRARQITGQVVVTTGTIRSPSLRQQRNSNSRAASSGSADATSSTQPES